MATDYIKTYAQKAQELITKDNADIAAIDAEIEKQKKAIADAEAAMDKAAGDADRTTYEAQEAIKTEAEKVIEWDERRKYNIQFGHSMDESDYRTALANIQKQQHEADDTAAEKIRDLASQIVNLIQTTNATLREGDNVIDTLVKEVYGERNEKGELFNSMDATAYKFVPRVRRLTYEQWANLLTQI